jgi:hypothetical protein
MLSLAYCGQCLYVLVLFTYNIIINLSLYMFLLIFSKCKQLDWFIFYCFVDQNTRNQDTQQDPNSIDFWK